MLTPYTANLKLYNNIETAYFFTNKGKGTVHQKGVLK